MVWRFICISVGVLSIGRCELVGLGVLVSKGNRWREEKRKVSDSLLLFV